MRILWRILLIPTVALVTGVLVVVACYVPKTIVSGRAAIYACSAIAVKAAPAHGLPGRSDVPPGGGAQECGFAPVPWWIKAAGVSGVLAAVLEMVLAYRRKDSEAGTRAFPLRRVLLH